MSADDPKRRPGIKAGFEGAIWVGDAGATATKQLQNVTDLRYHVEVITTEITPRDSGTTESNIPVESAWASKRKVHLHWSMLNKPEDGLLTKLIACARTATPVAIRTKSHVDKNPDWDGRGYDGDCVLHVEHEKNLKGISQFNFSAEVFDYYRIPKLNV